MDAPFSFEMHYKSSRTASSPGRTLLFLGLMKSLISQKAKIANRIGMLDYRHFGPPLSYANGNYPEMTEVKSNEASLEYNRRHKETSNTSSSSYNCIIIKTSYKKTAWATKKSTTQRRGCFAYRLLRLSLTHFSSWPMSL